MLKEIMEILDQLSDNLERLSRYQPDQETASTALINKSKLDVLRIKNDLEWCTIRYGVRE